MLKFLTVLCFVGSSTTLVFSGVSEWVILAVLGWTLASMSCAYTDGLRAKRRPR